MVVKRKQKIIVGISLVVIACLLLSSIYVYFEYYAKDKKVEPEEPTPTALDNRISPLENQGLVFEILRMRHRGLMEKLLKPGNSWENKPKFYFVTNMDGLEYTSKDVTQHGRTTEVFFTGWDTMFQENKIMKEVVEENETSIATLTIWEQVTSGLLGRKTSFVEKDSFNVVYDYRTGRWSGDDEFKDYDGYGHFLGDTFEIWFNLYQIDYDSDFIPYWTEVNILGTDPIVDDSKLDPDDDDIPTSWEWKWGYDPFTWDNHENLDPDLDGLNNIEEYQMADWFADPFIQDMYIEFDIMDRGGPLDPPHYLYEESKQGLIERFAEHNIRMYIDDGWSNGPTHAGGDLLPHIDKISQDSGMMLQFYNNYFPEERRGIFRYIVLGHDGGFSHPSKNNIYDTIQVTYASGKFQPKRQLTAFIRLGWVPTARGNRVCLGSCLLHELAHSCSVNADNSDFAGIDNVTYGNAFIAKKSYVWIDYRSSLNYFWMYHLDLFDLSDGINGEYDQNDWGLIFTGHFQYNSNLLEEPYYEPSGGKTLVKSEWRVTGYTYDENLTKDFVKYIGDYSPLDPIDVNWSVYKINDDNDDPNAKDVKVFAQPKIKTTQQWVLNTEGDLDLLGNMHFYSYDDVVKEKTQ